MPFDALAFEQLEEALGNSIIVTVSAATHTGLKAVGFQKVLPVMAGVLAALVTMNRNH